MVLLRKTLSSPELRLLLLLLAITEVIVIIKQHHLFLLLAFIILKLLELVGVGSADELAIHVENLPLWIHKELTIIALNLDPSHYHVVFEVDTHLLLIASVLLPRVERWLRGLVLLRRRHGVEHLIILSVELVLHVWVSVFKAVLNSLLSA